MHQTYILFFINEKVFEQMYELRVKKTGDFAVER